MNAYGGHRNQGELAEGWYDPETKRKADMRAREEERAERGGHNNDEDSDEVGPEIPDRDLARGEIAGPAMPKTQDLEYRRGVYPLLSERYLCKAWLTNRVKNDRNTS
jgi:hypothetical protein